jgi:hypothetical protein
VAAAGDPVAMTPAGRESVQLGACDAVGIRLGRQARRGRSRHPALDLDRDGAGAGALDVNERARAMDLFLPPDALQNVRQGDRVAVDIAIRPLP